MIFRWGLYGISRQRQWHSDSNSVDFAVHRAARGKLPWLDSRITLITMLVGPRHVGCRYDEGRPLGSIRGIRVGDRENL